MEGKEVYAVFAATTCDPKNGWPIVPSCVGVYTTLEKAQQAMVYGLKDSMNSWDIEYDEKEFEKGAEDLSYDDDSQPFWISSKAAGFNDKNEGDHWCWNIFQKSVK